MKKVLEAETDFRVRPGVTRRQLIQAGFEDRGNHWIYKQFLYERLVYVMILIDKEDLYCMTRAFRADRSENYLPFYNRIFGPKNLIRDKVDERYMRLLRRLNRADVIEFVKEKK